MPSGRLRLLVLGLLALLVAGGGLAAGATVLGSGPSAPNGLRAAPEPTAPPGSRRSPGATPAPRGSASTGSALPGSARTSSAPATRTAPASRAAADSSIAAPAGRSAARSLRGRVIVIDPGHNGANAGHPRTTNRLVNAGNGIRKPCNTTGTQGRTGYTESAYSYDVATRLAAVLRARGATVVLTRSSNHGVGPCIDARAAIANRAKADLLVSIHADGNLSPSARGFHVIRSTRMAGGPTVTARSASLATVLRTAFRSGTGMPYSSYLGGGAAITPRRDIGTLNLLTVPGVMIETGNMRHRADLTLLGSSTFRQREALALADGIGSFLTNR